MTPLPPITFVFDLNNLEFFDLCCTCPYDDHCKHLATSGLEFIDLLQIFKREKTGIDKVLIEAIENNKFYIGVSAGSIIPGPDIEIFG